MIRPAEPADLDWLVATEAAIFAGDAWSAALVTDALSDTLIWPDRGYVVLTVAGEIADLHRIAVLPQARRTGVAGELLAAALGRAEATDRLLLEVRADNTGARAFYAALGFTEADRRRRYYADGTDALVLLLPGSRYPERPPAQ